jgi:anti-anti-sigma regulatory factor
MLRITRVANGEVVFRLIGRMGAENIGELETLLSAETSGRHIVFDLKDLMLVDQCIVSFLGRCETNGIEIENCPAYIRKWIEQEGGGNSPQERG